MITFDGSVGKRRKKKGRNKSHLTTSSALIDFGNKKIFKIDTAYKKVTPIIAEFGGLLLAIELARDIGLQSVSFLGDCKMVVDLVAGRSKPGKPSTISLLAEAQEGLKAIPNWDIGWIPRKQNKMADSLCREPLRKVNPKCIDPCTTDQFHLKTGSRDIPDHIIGAEDETPGDFRRLQQSSEDFSSHQENSGDFS